MAIYKSTNVTDITNDPITILERQFGELKFTHDAITIAASPALVADDVILFTPIPSNALLHKINLRNDDLDSNGAPTLTVDIGLFYSGIGGTQFSFGNTLGTPLSSAAFALDYDGLQTANKTGTDLRYSVPELSTSYQEAWEFSSLTSDPGGILFLGATVKTAPATAQAGNIVVEVSFL